MKPNPSFYVRFRESINRFIRPAVAGAALLLFSRVWEAILLGTGGFPAGSFRSSLSGLTFDLYLWVAATFVLLVPYLVIFIFSRFRRVALAFAWAGYLLMVAIYLLLINYFVATKLQLGADLFGYSIDEIRETVGASGEMNFMTFLPVFLMVFLVWLLFRYLPSVRVSIATQLMLLVAMVVSVTAANPLPDPIKNPDSFLRSVRSNKLSFFVSSVYGWINESELTVALINSDDEDQQSHVQQDEVTLEELIRIVNAKDGVAGTELVAGPDLLAGGGFPSLFYPEENNKFRYVSDEFPLLHEENTVDVLSQFFKPMEQNPNFVFIVVESLGRSYSGGGKGSYLGSFTPFLDSLASHSLYWENCLSTTGRTFGVLPSMLASLPFAKNGFADLGNTMPDHLSLINLLKNRMNYTSRFYYGGKSDFDKMDLFFKRQGVEKIVDEKSFGAGYQRLPASGEGFSWGYGDREIFRKYTGDLDSRPGNSRIDVILTIAMHSPFKVQNQEKYYREFEERMVQLGQNDVMKKSNRQYREQFSTILYFDDALREFFREYSKKSSFANTIFIITGDHRMPEIPISTQIDRFHVPLVVYSPLLKQGVRFSSVVSHFDVTPSLLTLMKEKRGLKLPTLSAWIGHGLDSYTGFRNLRSYPMMRNTAELIDYVSGTKMISRGTAYEIYENMGMEPIVDQQVEDELNQGLMQFKARNKQATDTNRLIPDSLRIR